MAKEPDTVGEFLSDMVDPSCLDQKLTLQTKWELRINLLKVVQTLAQDLKYHLKCHNCGCVFKDSDHLFCPICKSETVDCFS